MIRSSLKHKKKSKIFLVVDVRFCEEGKGLIIAKFDERLGGCVDE